MTDLHLSRKRLEPGNIQGYNRNGFDLATAPIPEYVTLFSSLLADGKTAVWIVDFDFMPVYMTAKYTGTTGSVILFIKQSGVTIWTQTYNATEVVAGVKLPEIPIRHDNVEIHALVAKSVDFLWLSVRQCEVLEAIAPKSNY